METKKKHVVTKQYARKQFSLIGLVLIVYALFVLFVPEFLEILLFLTDNLIVKDTTLYVGFFYIFLVLGTFIPFYLLKSITKIKNKSYFANACISMKTLFIKFLIFFTLVSLSIFISASLFNNLSMEGKTVSSIGLVIDTKYMRNWLFIVTFIVATPILEEFAFRGILLSVLSKYGKYFAVITTSIMYALAHGSFTEMLPALIISFLLSKITLRYKSVKPAMIIHILFNGVFYLLMIIPDNMNLYVIICLIIIYIISFILLTKKVYMPIKISRPDNMTRILGTFFSCTSVIIACTLFIFSSVLMLFL